MSWLIGISRLTASARISRQYFESMLRIATFTMLNSVVHDEHVDKTRLIRANGT